MSKILKWKACLNVHGGQWVYGINYWEIYAPVVNWFAIRLLLILSLPNNWSMRQIDFISAYPKAPIKCNLYMMLPPGIATKDGTSKTHVLKLEQNLYNQKQVGWVWNQYLTEKLKGIGAEQSNVDECIFYRGE
eukprot:8312012-Ditylum_brightwellii.AAC.2